MAIALEEVEFETYSSEKQFIPNRNILNEKEKKKKSTGWKFNKKKK